jgi:glucokinase
MKIGIDIGGTNSSWGLVNDKAEIITQGKVSTKGEQHFENYILSLSNSIRKKVSKEQLSQLKGIGIGAPNGNVHTGQIEFAPNLPWKGVLPLATKMKQQFDTNVLITNDANAAAMGEKEYGAAKGVDNFIMVTLGTGVGSGFVSNGELIYGHDGLAGELGHVIAVRDGRNCGCGRKGCLETYTSATGIVRTAEEFLIKKKTDSPLANEINLNSHKIFLAAQQGDPTALAIFDFTGKILGQSLADAVAITSPKMIILFGGLALSGNYILTPTRKYFEENLLKIYQNKVSIEQSKLPNNTAAILGASALITN